MAAKVTTARRHGGYAGSTSYLIEGETREEVEAARDRVLEAWDPRGYGTLFGKVEEVAPGTWRVHGDRSNSCD